MIHFKKVLFEFNNGNGIKDTTFNIESGEYVCIIGPTGAGKTTLLKLMWINTIQKK